jgi:recombinational DNA repair protein (RecF pathway)
MPDIPEFAECCVCGQERDDVLPTLAEGRFVCRPCDDKFKRRRSFKAVEDGLRRMKELDDAENEQCDRLDKKARGA